MAAVNDGLKLKQSWKLEIFGQNPLIEDWLEDKGFEQKKAIREFLLFLSDTYPSIRSALFGPAKSVEEIEEN